MLFTALCHRVWFISQECSETSSLLGTAAWKKGVMHRVSPTWSLVQSNPTVFLVTKTLLLTQSFHLVPTHTSRLFQSSSTIQLSVHGGMQLEGESQGGLGWAGLREGTYPGGLWVARSSGITLCFSSLPWAKCLGWRLEGKSDWQDHPLESQLFFRQRWVTLLSDQLAGLTDPTARPLPHPRHGYRSKGPRCHPFSDRCKRPSKV